MPADPAMRRALDRLDKRNVLFAIHAASFPPSPGDDLGVGTPHSEAAAELFEELAALGYTGVLLGPEGQTSPGNPSPYDATWFSRDPLLVSPKDLARRGLLTDAELRIATSGVDTAPWSEPDAARRRWSWVFEHAWRRRAETGDAPSEFARAHADWIEPDAAADALRDLHGPAPEAWPATLRDLFDHDGAPRAATWAPLTRTFAERIERHAFAQWLVADQRLAVRRRLQDIGLSLWGDLQIGASPTDAWRFRSLMLPGYALGAPPSRTNPDGQPWGYPIWNPDLEGRFIDVALAPRMARFAADYDGLRIDHPHGWVCPWVYRAHAVDPQRAVQWGARLFESPAEDDHPELARFARVGADQRAPAPRPPRYDDAWVRDLAPSQIERYAAILRRLTTPFLEPESGRARVACEVLSTQPRPLEEVVQALGIGRFRVTQKADPDDASDVYRSERAAPDDWVMVGTHDTPSLWELADTWVGAERGAREARALGARLRASDREVRALATDPRSLVHAKMAEAFASPAQNVIVFFADHFGVRTRFNTPGTVGPHNWRARAPSSRATHAELDLRAVLHLALRMRGLDRGPEAQALAAETRPQARLPSDPG